MSEEAQAMHWMESEAVRKRFWAYAKNDLGLTEDEVHEALNVESTKDFDGDKDMARAMLKAYAVDIDDRRLIKSLKPQGPSTDTPRTVAFCDVFAPDGTRIALTAREGATADTVALTALALWEGAGILERLGFTLAAENGKQAAARLQPQKAMDETTTSAVVAETETGGNGGSETFIVESITAEQTRNGKRCYAVRGGRVSLHGVTAWPEIAEPQIQALDSFDLTALEVGQKWTPTKRLQAVGAIPEGKEWPNKVTAFAPAP